MKLRCAAYFAILLMGAVGTGGATTQTDRVIEVVAKRFSFEPKEITIKKGESVTLALISEDVDHGLVIEDLSIRTEIHKGTTSNITLKSDSAGTFPGKCGHFCGAGHGSMTLTVRVVE